MLWQKCKSSCFSKYIHAFWVSSGTLILKLTESGRVNIITHKIWMSYYPKNELLRDEQ